MTWYAASIITIITYVDSSEKIDHIPALEDMYLIEADSFESAQFKAENLGKFIEDCSDGLSYFDKPAKQNFLGVRSLKCIFPPVSSIGADIGDAPEDGSEIFSNYIELKTMEDAILLAQGENVVVEYCCK